MPVVMPAAVAGKSRATTRPTIWPTVLQAIRIVRRDRRPVGYLRQVSQLVLEVAREARAGVGPRHHLGPNPTTQAIDPAQVIREHRLLACAVEVPPVHLDPRRRGHVDLDPERPV